MQEGLGSMSREAARVLAERKERQEMHLRSKAAVRDWTNTIMVSTACVSTPGDLFSCMQKGKSRAVWCDRRAQGMGCYPERPRRARAEGPDGPHEVQEIQAQGLTQGL